MIPSLHEFIHVTIGHGLVLDLADLFLQDRLPGEDDVGPPTIAMLGKATGEEKYYDYLNKVYWDVTDHLFDEEYGLFYRDKRFFDAKTDNGKKVYDP